MKVVLESHRKRIAPLERLVEFFAASLGRPSLRGPEGNKGYRYDAPDLRHFCLLKSARIVSALNAMVELARLGYSQEFCVLIRTIAEFTTHIEYVLDQGSAEHRRGVDEYVRAFFADYQRELGAPIVKTNLHQSLVHAKLGETLDEIAEWIGKTEERKPARELYSNVFRIFSNYVHGKYPEIMDMYGGSPGHFHLRGMAGTPKDAENLTQLDTFIETVSNTFVIMIKSLGLLSLIEKDRELEAWYRERIS